MENVIGKQVGYFRCRAQGVVHGGHFVAVPFPTHAVEELGIVVAYHKLVGFGIAQPKVRHRAASEAAFQYRFKQIKQFFRGFRTHLAYQAAHNDVANCPYMSTFVPYAENVIVPFLRIVSV